MNWQGLKADGAAHLTEQRLTYIWRASDSNLGRHINHIHTWLWRSDYCLPQAFRLGQEDNNLYEILVWYISTKLCDAIPQKTSIFRYFLVLNIRWFYQFATWPLCYPKWQACTSGVCSCTQIRMQHKTIQDTFLCTVFGYLTTLFEMCKWHIFRSAFILHAEHDM